MSPPLSPTSTAAEELAKKDVWEEALMLLSEEDRERFDVASARKQEYQQLLKDVLAASNEKKAECLKKRWKIIRGDRNIILRDIIEKVAIWVRKFIAVGDTLMQYDPGHAALPWAAIRFFLQVTVNDVQIYGTMLQSIELISNLLARCAIMERLYLQRPSLLISSSSSLDVTERFRKALVELYAAILTILAKALRYYGYNTAVRIAKSIVTNTKDVESWSSMVSEKQAEVERLATVAEAEKMQQEHDQRDAKLSQLLKELQTPISRMDMHLSDLHDNLQMEMRIKILKAISTIPYPVHHKAIARDRLKGSGKWLLEKPAYRDWRAESSSSVLWVHGIPGSGKTKLASLVIDDIKSSAHVAHFYCMRNPAEPERAKCDKILNCLVRQLASTSPKSPILEPVRVKYELAIDGFEGFEDQAWTSDESTQVLIELINIYPSVTFVLDALDEVNPMDRLELLDALNKIAQNSESLVKVFISSRDNIDIVMHLKDSPNLYISATDNWKDINAFLTTSSNQRLDAVKLLHGKLPSSLRDKIATTLISGAHGMFRWVDLQIQSLRTLKVAADIEARLGHLPETLEGSYWEIFQYIQESGEHAAKLARLTFQWLLSAKSSISLDNFAVLASISCRNPGTVYTPSEILDVCANLVINDGATSFRFAHLSVREFLE
ncbi:uncharacterized protein K441DRAFT_557014, partial [Cenococcum geophilum 1.58]|uniref:uncharacterized protein n=1 Tax=Cenococcum geophilum 1.58 TaxID=794803 RepID=UPI00358EDDDD